MSVQKTTSILMICFMSILSAKYCCAKVIESSQRQNTIVLASNGEPKATIVISENSPRRVKQAANELKRYIKEICGVKLPINHNGKKVSGVGLYIGKCDPTSDLDLPPKRLNPESYAIKIRAGNLFFVGRYPTTTYWSVISFIEQDLGVDWFAPGKLWTYIPAGNKGELKLTLKSRIFVPDVSPRIWSGNSWFSDWKSWNLHNRIAYPGVWTRRNFQGSRNIARKALPPDKYAKSHPEYYPIVHGHRWIPSSGSVPNWMPEMSNRDVIRIVAEYAHKYFQKHPNVNSVSLGQEGIRYWSDKDRANLPDSYYQFVNAVASRLQKTDPGKFVGAFIYDAPRFIPHSINHLEPNVFGYLVQRCFAWWQPDRKIANDELSRRWSQLCDHISRYDYYGMGTITPRFAPHYMAHEIKFDQSLGFEGMYIETYTFMPNTAPMMWALAQMQWNSSLDVDHLLNQFYKKMYGSASQLMSQYFALLENSWTQNRPGRTRHWVHHDIAAQAQAMTPAQLNRAMELLKQALHKSNNKKIKKRIKINKAGLRYGGYLIKGYNLSQKISHTNVSDKITAKYVLDLAKQLSKVGKHRKFFWDKAKKRNDLLSETIRGLYVKKKYGPIARETTLMEKRGILTATIKSLGWLSNHVTPIQYKRMMASLKGQLDNNTLDITKRVNAVLLNKNAINLLKNGTFEMTGKNATRVRNNWTTQGTPPHWSFWSRRNKAKYGISTGKGKRSSSAVFIKNAEAGVFVQKYQPVKPGQIYLLVGWAKITPPTATAGVGRLVVRFQTPTGTWMSGKKYKSRQITGAHDGMWQKLMIVFKVPKKAGGIFIELSAIAEAGPNALSRAGRATIWFDNLALYRVE